MGPTPEQAAGGRDEPEPRSALRNLLAYGSTAGGVVLLALGWYGISGTAEVARQLPYLASASLPGVALLIGGAVIAAADRTRRSNERAADMVATLYRLLTEAADTAPLPSTDAEHVERDGTLVALEDSPRYHRATCALVRGKPGVAVVTTAEIDERRLRPCPICEPSGSG